MLVSYLNQPLGKKIVVFTDSLPQCSKLVNLCSVVKLVWRGQNSNKTLFKNTIIISEEVRSVSISVIFQLFI